ncbi:hypothetical protein GCM10008959_33230 [Deinococcus seoulensis]|uniref:Uncharacterized protein n=1 Tax=Deinococcus seoulensis TaxID=1837379 RepID=A0ABQ2RZ68_9DEIO|nr:hypothetical protein GCM10008959_33230 [Deinococcus seoulensis]
MTPEQVNGESVPGRGVMGFRVAGLGGRGTRTGPQLQRAFMFLPGGPRGGSRSFFVRLDACHHVGMMASRFNVRFRVWGAARRSRWGVHG